MTQLKTRHEMIQVLGKVIDKGEPMTWGDGDSYYCFYCLCLGHYNNGTLKLYEPHLPDCLWLELLEVHDTLIDLDDKEWLDAPLTADEATCFNNAEINFDGSDYFTTSDEAWTPDDKQREFIKSLSKYMQKTINSHLLKKLNKEAFKLNMHLTLDYYGCLKIHRILRKFEPTIEVNLSFDGYGGRND